MPCFFAIVIFVDKSHKQHKQSFTTSYLAVISIFKSFYLIRAIFVNWKSRLEFDFLMLYFIYLLVHYVFNNQFFQHMEEDSQGILEPSSHQNVVKDCVQHLNQSNQTLNSLQSAGQNLILGDKAIIEDFLTKQQSFEKPLDIKQLRVYFNIILQQKKMRKLQYDGAIEALKYVIQRNIKDLMSKISERQLQYYEQVLSFNSLIFKKNSFNDQVITTIQKLVRIDILSLFFKKNHELKRKHGLQISSFLIKPQTLHYLFNISHSIITLSNKRYLQFEDHLIFEYQPIFQGLVLLTSALEIYKKIFNILTYHKGPKIPAQSKTGAKNAKKQSKTIKYKSPFLYKLSQLLYVSQGNQMQKFLGISSKCEVVEQLKLLSYFEDEDKIKRLFLKIKYNFGVTFESLSLLYDGIFNKSNLSKRNFKCILEMKSVLLKCQWVMSQTGNIHIILRKLINQATSEHNFFKNHYISDFLFRLGKKRLRLLQFVLTKYKQNLNSPINYYICRLEYSLKKLKEKTNLSSQNKYKDIRSTVILITDQRNIISFEVNRTDFKFADHLYVKALVDCFTNMEDKFTQRPFILYLYQFHPLKFIDWLSYLKMNRFFIRYFDSFAYVTNRAADFKLHFLLHVSIIQYLQYFSSKISEENFYDYVNEAIILFISIIQNNNHKINRRNQSRLSQ